MQTIENVISYILSGLNYIYHAIVDFPFRMIHVLLDLVNYVMSLVPSPTFSLQSYFSGIDPAALQMLGLIGFYQGVGLVVAGLTVRAVLMLFGR